MTERTSLPSLPLTSPDCEIYDNCPFYRLHYEMVVAQGTGRAARGLAKRFEKNGMTPEGVKGFRRIGNQRLVEGEIIFREIEALRKSVEPCETCLYQ